MPPGSAESLDSLMWLLSDNLTPFINLSNRVLKNSGSFLSLFRRVPFAQLAEEAHQQAARWQAMMADIDARVRPDAWPTLNPREREVFDAMVEWGNAVAAAAARLAENQQVFLEASQRKRKITFAETCALNKAYDQAQQHYHQLGIRLQSLYKSLQARVW